MASSPESLLEETQREDATITFMAVDEVLEQEDMMGTLETSRSAKMSRPLNALSKLVDSDTESETNEAPAEAPRGKLMTRLQPQNDEQSSESDEEDDDEGAYERVKKMLMSNSGPKDSQEGPQVAEKVVEPANSEDEEDMPVRMNKTRRLAARKEKSSSQRASLSHTPRSRRSSPGLFVTPEPSPVTRKVTKTTPAPDSDSEDFSRPRDNEDLMERIKRIRAERKAMEKKEREQESRTKAARRQATQESDSDPDGEIGRRLTQQSRPTRKAGKKALEDITREQQRISRNMQLTHQAKTKKKYGIKDLLSKFGHNQLGPELVLPSPDASSMLASSDAEANQSHDTPPTSPPSQDDIVEKEKTQMATETTPQEQRITAESTSTSAPPMLPKVDKGKGRAPEFEHLPLNPLVQQSQLVTVTPAQVGSRRPARAEIIELSDSDDDVQVVKPRSRFPVFDRMPQKKQQEAPSLLHLRHLAHLTSPGKKVSKGRKSMNIAELQFSLAQKARQQAHKEREEKIEDLRRRGIHIETEEERERNQLAIEDMVAQFEKTRQEDLKLAKLEKDEAKKNGDTGDGLLSSDDSEDDDYVGSGQEEVDQDEEEADVELSGSEDEDMAEADDEEEFDEGETGAKSNGFLDDVAEEDDQEEEEEVPTGDALLDDEEEVEEEAPARKRVAHRTRNVVVDDDDESGDESPKKATPTKRATESTQTQEDDGMAAFGFNNADATLGLTQMFAGTMANIDSDSQNAHPLDKEPEQDSLDFLRSLPDTQPDEMLSQAANMLVPNSQAAVSGQNESQVKTVTQLSMEISQLIQTSPAFSHTQLSEAFEPTQDAGFELSRSPAGLIPPPSTVDTVMMPIAESPLVKRKGRLQQRRQMANTELSDVDDDLAASGDEHEPVEESSKTGDAFSVLKKGAKKQKRIADNFNKKTSWARDAIEDQAQESEDEYAGIGGASDEDSGEEDEELAQMIDTNDVKVDERKLAAYYAEKSKFDDEKNVERLYKDLLTGGLRKRRGGDAFEVSDSEDEAEQRRRKKQMQFKQMTKALISDERIGKIADNPKKSAFFNTLADHLDDPDYDFLDAPGMDVEIETSQSQSEENIEEQDSTEVSIPDSQAADATIVTPVNPLKRKATDSQGKENRPPPHLRRTAASDNLSRRPMTIADVQHSVSELLDDPRIIIPDSQYSSDSDLEIEPPAPALTSRKPIIDRLNLSRASSISDTNAVSVNMAFVAPNPGAHAPGFRVPGLVRRATGNLSAVSTNSSGASTPVEGGGVRRGGTGRSNIHAQAREAERRAALEKVEAKRKERLKKKVGKARVKRSVLGCLDGGFE